MSGDQGYTGISLEPRKRFISKIDPTCKVKYLLFTDCHVFNHVSESEFASTRTLESLDKATCFCHGSRFT